jgi:hypothetical protein
MRLQSEGSEAVSTSTSISNPERRKENSRRFSRVCARVRRYKKDRRMDMRAPHNTCTQERVRERAVLKKQTERIEL